MGIYSAFADLLSYPRHDLLAVVDRCVAAVSRGPSNDEVAKRALLAFRATVERLGVPRLEDAYIAAFDLDPACSLYVGHHVFGENARRSLFMWRLLRLYRESGLACPPGEPPDHLPLVLRYLDAGPAGTAMRDLLSDAVAPAMARVAGALGADHPYTSVVQALLAELAGTAARTCGQGTVV